MIISFQIDLDTIEVSNLNRQFYFRNEHVGQSKALVAARIVMQQNPKLKIIAHHKNVMDPQFTLKYFSSFKAVILALDNEDARSYVNKVCMLTDRLVLEAGTSGFLGQVEDLSNLGHDTQKKHNEMLRLLH